MDADDVVVAAQLGERAGKLCGYVGLGVAEGREQEDASVGSRAGKMPKEQERRCVGPVSIFEHEH